MADEAEKPKKPGKKKGAPKSGGRQKGARNRNSLNVLTALDKANIPLVELFLLDVAALPEAHQRVTEYKWLFQFCYPKLKDIEFNPPPASPAGTQQATPPVQPTREERLNLIRGHDQGKSATSGK